MNNDFREQTPPSSPTDLTLSFVQKHMGIQGIRTTESMTTPEWTDEKHSMYLKSIEASFVNQLYDSKHILPSLSRKGTSYDPPIKSGQFKVLHGGRWKKISFERENQQISRPNQRHDLTVNPWIQHYRSSSKQPSIAAPSLQESVTSTSQAVDLGRRKGISSESGKLHLFKSHVCHQDMLCSDTEVSDQNFVDDEEEGKKENNRTNVKRLKSLNIDAKGNDQMVPLSKSSTTGDATKNSVSAT